MNSLPPHGSLFRVAFVFLMASGSCASRSIIGQQTGQGGAQGAGGTGAG